VRENVSFQGLVCAIFLDGFGEEVQICVVVTEKLIMSTSNSTHREWASYALFFAKMLVEVLGGNLGG
jgi:hypothetical protein